MKKYFPAVESRSFAKDCRTVLPHPGPLPLGEGESSAAAGESREPEMAGRLSANNSERWLSPSPSGRGIKGEGEPCGNFLCKNYPGQTARAK